MASLFDYEDYKEFIRHLIQQNKMEKAYQSQLAQAAGCQKSFFSQVLNSHVQLTPDHAAGLCDFWGLADAETDHFFLLVLLARSSSAKLSAMLKKKIKALKQKQGDPTERFPWPKLGGHEEFHYYSSWHLSALHIIVSIDRYQTVASIAERLRIPRAVAENGLSWLENAKLIAKTKKGWEVTQKSVYLPNTSPMNEAHHLAWRQRAMLNVQNQDRDAVHYSAVLGLSRKDYEDLKSFLVDSIQEMNRRVAPSPSEEIVGFTCDLFKI